MTSRMSTGLRPSSGHESEQFVGRQSRFPCRRQRRLVTMPGEAPHVFAQHADGVGIVFGQVLREARHGRVHQCAAEFLLCRDLAGGGLEQRRAGQEGARAVAHHHHVVGHPRHVGAARGGAAVHDREHRNARGGEACEARVVRAAEDEVLDAVAQQVGAGGLDQVHERQPVLERQLLGALELLESHRLQRAGLDAGIVDDDDTARAADQRRCRR